MLFVPYSNVGVRLTPKKGYIYNDLTGHVCNVDYIGRTKVKGFTYVLGKSVKIELDLKTLKFVE